MQRHGAKQQKYHLTLSWIILPIFCNIFRLVSHILIRGKSVRPYINKYIYGIIELHMSNIVQRTY